ncbi:MAG: ATP-binding protein [Veillonella sp.]|uniref:AAA family ATPase n=1 Tax=Veillonella sp. TaxID=1926307 RepID=UPI0034124A8D|nr:ATP-binding protein [Veillonella sp.]
MKTGEFAIDNIAALVGENNSGKTSVLRALNAVFNYLDEEPYFRNESHKYSSRANTHIKITLIDENNSFGKKVFLKMGRS